LGFDFLAISLGFSLRLSGFSIYDGSGTVAGRGNLFFGLLLLFRTIELLLTSDLTSMI